MPARRVNGRDRHAASWWSKAKEVQRAWLPAELGDHTAFITVSAGLTRYYERALSASRLLTHDVASPLMSSNMEVTTLPAEEDPRRYIETLWRVDAENTRHGERIRSVGMYFRLVNVEHKVAVHTHTGALPAWGFLRTIFQTNETGLVLDTTATNAPHRFYRARLAP